MQGLHGMMRERLTRQLLSPAAGLHQALPYMFRTNSPQRSAANGMLQLDQHLFHVLQNRIVCDLTALRQRLKPCLQAPETRCRQVARCQTAQCFLHHLRVATEPQWRCYCLAQFFKSAVVGSLEPRLEQTPECTQPFTVDTRLMHDLMPGLRIRTLAQ